jgi:hypothetical protein
MTKKPTLLMLLLSLLAASLACSLFESGSEQVAVVEDTAQTVELEPVLTEVVVPTEQEAESEIALEITNSPDEEGSASESGGEVSEYDTVFPLPGDVQDFLDLGDDAINFKTSLSVKEAIDFYRQAFKAENLTERSLNTAITETTFSLVFNGHSSGKAIVIQGVDLGDGTTNINIRFEDL